MVHPLGHPAAQLRLIPPYYRPKHRPNLTKDEGGLESVTVAQLRYVELSVLQVAAGLNGWAVIKEEKVGVCRNGIRMGKMMPN